MPSADIPRTRRGEISNDSRRPDLDVLFEILSDRRRRLALYHLSDAETATTDELVRVVSERDGADRDAVEVALRHTHLPKLENAGVIATDPRTGAVRYEGEPFVEAILARTVVEDRRRD